MKNVTFKAKDVKLILNNNELNEMAAEASISLNRHVSWMKLVLLDDDFNANRQRVPREEFANVLKTGQYMPIKMAYGEIEDGHDNAFPLGVMAHLKVNGDTIEALAALWKRERPDDINFLKEKYDKGEPIDFSWELTFTQSELSDDGETLKDVSMNAATIVGEPAYTGRTPALAISSDNNEGENDKMDENTITKEAHELEITKLANENKEALAEETKAREDAEKALAELQEQYDELKAFKDEYDAEQAKAAKLDEIKNKFAEAKLEVEDDYFETKAEVLLAMEDAQLDFFIQELVAAMASKKDEEDDDSEASLTITSKNVPNFGRRNDDDVDENDIVAFLRKQDE